MTDKTIAFFNGEYLPKSEVHISPDDRGFLFADGVYEVIRSYHGKLFRAKEHIRRLENSLAGIKIPYKAISDLEKIAEELISKNSLQRTDALVYIQITRGAYKRTHQFPVGNIVPTVYCCAAEVESDTSETGNGISAALLQDTRWERCDIKSIALLPNILARQEATVKGAGEGIFVRNGIITEGTHTSVFGVRSGELITHPATNNILSGITRSVVMELCVKQRIRVTETSISINDLPFLDELFIAGSTVEITPVIRVDDLLIGNGKPGSVTGKLQTEFRKLTF